MEINLKNRILDTLSDVFDCALTGFYWLICSLPIITAGTASAAAYSVLLDVDRSTGSITGKFFRAFRSNFRETTRIWCVLLLCGFIIGINMNYCCSIETESKWNYISRILLSAAALCTLTCMTVIFPITAKFKVTFSQAFYNVFVYTLKAPGWVFLMLALTMAMALGFYLLLAFGFLTAGLCMYLQSLIFIKMNPDFFPKESDME